MGIGRSIRPILSVGMNFYVRVFVEVNSHGPSVKNLSCSIWDCVSECEVSELSRCA